jgi:hypothetical protein
VNNVEIEHEFKAIPTRYADVEFRSRLEARWAAFFDALGWKWEYEPAELDGWIPDFRLNFPCPVWVEIKPAESLKALGSYEDRLTKQDTDHVILLVGERPVFGAAEGPVLDNPTGLKTIEPLWIGRIRHRARNKGLFNYCLWQFCSECGQDSFEDCDCLWPPQCSLCRVRQDELEFCWMFADSDWLEYCWKAAGNHTQWKGRKFGHRIDRPQLIETFNRR